MSTTEADFTTTDSTLKSPQNNTFAVPPAARDRKRARQAREAAQFESFRRGMDAEREE